MEILFNHQVNIFYISSILSVLLPALVPIHSRSLQANNAVILRQAALCCLMMASAPEWTERKERIGWRSRKRRGEDSGKRLSEVGIPMERQHRD